MKRLTLFTVLFFFAASLSYAQKQYDELEFPELNEFNEPDVETFITSNGIKFYLVEDHELPLIDVNVIVRTGGVMIPDEKTGLTSLTGRVMRLGGTSNYPADSLNKILESNAANMSTYIGFTSGGAGLNVLKGDFEELLPVFVDVLVNPAFPEEKIDLAKTQTKSAISRRNDNARSIAGREFDQLIYGENSKYGRTTEYETINNITREDMVAFHNEYFTGENMMVGVVGDFDTEQMKEKLRQAFGEIPAGEETDLAFPDVDYDFDSTINLADKPSVNQSTVYLGHIGGMRDNPDYAEVQVMNNVLSGGFSGRLFQKVRTDLGLAYSVGGQYGMSNPFYPGLFFVQVQTKTGSTAEAIDAIITEIERLQNEPISEEELQNTKDQFLNSLVFRNVSYSQILNRRMSNDYRGLPEDSFEEFVEGVRNTTIEDVQNMAQQYLQPENMQILVVGNKEALNGQLQKYGEVNELDISIPRPGDGQEEQAVEGDPEMGAELLGEMADAIIAPGTELNTLTVSGEVMVGGRTLATTMTIDFPDTITQTIETARGTMNLSYEDGTTTMNMAGQERTLPASSPMVSGLKAALNRSIVAIALKADELNPQYLGTAEFQDETYNKVSVEVSEKNLTILLDQETNLPSVLRFQQFNPQMGGEITVESRYSNWTTSGGVTYPYKQVSYSDEQKAATAVYTDHSVN